MITRALAFIAGLLVQRMLSVRDDFEERLEALEDEAEARAEHRCAAPRDVDGRERSTTN